MRKLLIALAVVLILAGPASGIMTISHEPKDSVSKNKDIYIEAEVYSDVQVVKVEVFPIWDSTWGPIELTLDRGTDTNGVWVATIPAQNKTGVLYYRIESRDADGMTKVKYYEVQVYSGEPDSVFDLLDNPWVMGIGIVLLVGAVVILEIIFKKKLFPRKQKEEESPRRAKAKKIKKK